MTGFGRATVEQDDRKISIELKAVNHRYLDLNIRMPRAISMIEGSVRKKMKDTLARGHVDIYINYKNSSKDAKEISVDEGLALAYFNALKKINEVTGASNDISTSNVARMNEVLVISEADEDEKLLTDLMNEALDIALTGLCKMRAREGAALKEDMLANITVLEESLKEVEKRAPIVPKMYKEKLLERLEDLMKDSDAKLDDQRLMTEIALYCDKCSIAEEISRLVSHLNEFRKMSNNTQPVGRSMDFLVQEMNRETNTICSKANDIDITSIGLGMKSVVEKIREQVQNVE